MDLSEFLQEVRTIPWFDHSGGPSTAYHVVGSVFEAYDTWNAPMLNTWEPQITSLEAMAVERLGDAAVDDIFSRVSQELDDVLWARWGQFIARWHLEHETGLEAELLDMVKRDLSWACVERMLNVPGFFHTLLAIYKNGYFPCGWMGAYPAGQALVL